VCVDPVPERNKKKSTLRCQLYSEKELQDIFEKRGFEFHANNLQKGTLLYFLQEKKSTNAPTLNTPYIVRILGLYPTL
jgi:hypothetical protein